MAHWVCRDCIGQKEVECLTIGLIGEHECEICHCQLPQPPLCYIETKLFKAVLARKTKGDDNHEYVTYLKCPVCGAVMDEIRHSTPTLSGMSAGLLGGDGRREHKRKSPSCSEHDRWSLGWTTETVKREQST